MHPELDFPAFQWLRSCRSIEYDHSKALVLSHQQVQPISPSTHPSFCPGIPFQTSVSPPDSLPCSVPRKQAKTPSSLSPTRILISPAERCVFWAADTEVTRKKMGESALICCWPHQWVFFVASETCKICRPLQNRPCWPTGWVSFPQRREKWSQVPRLALLLVYSTRYGIPDSKGLKDSSCGDVCQSLTAWGLLGETNGEGRKRKFLWVRTETARSPSSLSTWRWKECSDNPR